MSIQEEAKNIRQKLEELDKTKVKVALFGQPGAGKSSLINALIGEKKAEVGVNTDCSKELVTYEWNDLILGDLPGYDTKKFPRETFFNKFRIMDFDLFLCVFEGKFHQPDSEFFSELVKVGKTCIFVRNKHDAIWEERKNIEALENEIYQDLNDHAGKNQSLVFTSTRTRYGLDKLQELIVNNLDKAKKEKWLRNAKAYSIKFLSEKKKICERYVTIAAGSSAANALNPIPGLDISIDVATLLSLFQSIRKSYGITNEKLSHYETIVQGCTPLAKNIILYSTKEGAFTLLKRFAGLEIGKEIGKYIPFVGQAIAALAGFALTKYAGNAFLEDCHKIAVLILEEELKRKPEQK